VAQITIRDIDEATMDRLRKRAEQNRRSVSAEARHILREVLADHTPPVIGLGTRIASRFVGLGLDFEIEEIRGEEARPWLFDSDD
jgi:plasmid stability protein